MLVKKINVTDVSDRNAIAKTMETLAMIPMDCVNWSDRFPSAVKAGFKIGHNGEYVFIQYFVEEDEILAAVEADDGEVWTDSCVEFFISFGESPYYYNAEFSCIGKALMGYRKDRYSAEKASSEILSSMKRYPSLGVEPFGKKQGDFSWNILVAIPAGAYWRSGLTTFEGVKARANFYKCGDKLTHPHFLSWSPVKTEEPNFHLPEFFGELEFES